MTPAMWSEKQILEELIRILINQYGYSKEQIEKEVCRSENLAVDCVVYEDQERKKPIIVIEIKKGSRIDSIFARDQLAFMMRTSGARYGILASEIGRRVFTSIGSEISEIPDLPTNGAIINESISKNNLRRISDISKIIWEVFNHLRSSEDIQSVGLDLLKLLICKIEDERTPQAKARFYVTAEEAERAVCDKNYQELKDRIQSMFSQVTNRFHAIPENISAIHLSSSSIYYIVARLQYLAIDGHQREIIDFLLTNWLRRSLGQMESPLILSRFMVDMVQPKPDMLILNPASGSGTLLSLILERIPQLTTKIAPNNGNLIGIESNGLIIEFLSLRFILEGRDCPKILHSDYLFDQIELGDARGADLIISIPPFGKRIRVDGKEISKVNNWVSLLDNPRTVDALILFLLRSVDYLKPSGVVAAVVTPNLLFSNAKTFRNAREQILRMTNPKAIIGIPSGVFFPYTNIPSVLMILEKKNDSRGEERNFENDVFIAEIENNQESAYSEIVNSYRQFYGGKTLPVGNNLVIMNSSKLRDNWSPRSLISSTSSVLSQNTRKLIEIADVLRGRWIQTNRINAETIEDTIPYIRISDIVDEAVVCDFARRVPKSYGDRTLLREGDILLSNQGTIGKIALVSRSAAGSIPSSQIFVIRPHPNEINPDFLKLYLTSMHVKSYLKGNTTGMYIPKITKRDVENLPIPIVDIQTQKEIIEKSRGIQIKSQQLTEQLAESREEFEEMIRRIMGASK